MTRHVKDVPRKFSLYGKVFVSHGSWETIPETIDMINMERIISRNDTGTTSWRQLLYNQTTATPHIIIMSHTILMTINCLFQSSVYMYILFIRLQPVVINVPRWTSMWSANFQMTRSKVDVSGHKKEQTGVMFTYVQRIISQQPGCKLCIRHCSA